MSEVTAVPTCPVCDRVGVDHTHTRVCNRFYAPKRPLERTELAPEPRSTPEWYYGPGWSQRLRNVYGLTSDDFYALVIEQGGKCAICGDRLEHGTTVVDHCHESGEVRGLLCPHCNRGLGCFRDRLMSLDSAVLYLRKSMSKRAKRQVLA